MRSSLSQGDLTAARGGGAKAARMQFARLRSVYNARVCCRRLLTLMIALEKKTICSVIAIKREMSSWGWCFSIRLRSHLAQKVSEARKMQAASKVRRSISTASTQHKNSARLLRSFSSNSGANMENASGSPEYIRG